MSHISVHRVEQIAKRRLARIAQIEAMPPQPERYDGDHWNFTRPSIVHAVYPGLAANRIGKDDPRVADIKSKALAANIDIDIVNDLTLDDFIVFPDGLSATIGGISFRSQFRSDAIVSELSVTDAYVPTGQTRIVTVQMNELNLPAGVTSSFYGDTFPSPVIVKNINYSGGIITCDARDWITFAVPSTGFHRITNAMTCGITEEISVPMMSYVLWGAVRPEIHVWMNPAAVNRSATAGVTVTVELLKRKAA